MNGGVSQMDTFDHKPELHKLHGQKFDPGGGMRVEAVTSTPGTVLEVAVPLRQHGQCGRWVSDFSRTWPVRRRPGVPDGDGVGRTSTARPAT